MRKLLPLVSIALIVGVGTAFSYYLGTVDARQRSITERGRVEVELAAVRAQLDGQIKATFGVTQGLVDIIGLRGGISSELFAQMVELAMDKSPHIRNIALAPRDIIADVYPRAGNEKAIGLDYASAPAQYRTVLRARKLRKPVLSEPINLVQGGRGLIQRAPVFLHRTAAGDPSAYWGMVSVVAHVDALFAEAHVSVHDTLAIALLRHDEKYPDKVLFEGASAVLEQNPVTLDMAVPGGLWQLAATPKKGWATLNPLASLYFQFGLAITVLLSVIAAILLNNAHKLHLRNNALLQEIRERKRAEEGLRLAAAVYKSTDQGIIVTDNNACIVSVNRAFTEITGFGSDEIEGMNFGLLQAKAQLALGLTAMWEELARTGPWQGELHCRRKSGEEFPCWATISVIDGGQGGEIGYVIVMSDISSLIHTQNQLEHLAHYDALTGLPNRLLFQDRLNQAIKRKGRHQTLMALLLLDLDGFKTVNDSHGHPVGDKLLQAVALRLQSSIRTEDTVARLGGDEFALILDNLANAEGAVEVALKLLAVVAQPYDLECAHAEISTSIGISIYPLDADNSTDLIRNADTAMYSAKEQGPNNYRFYQASMTQVTQSKLELERALRKCLDNNELEIWYQPQISLHTGEMTGAEALLRWRSATLGMVSPAEFIPLAERTGLIIPIGAFVLQQVCRDGRQWLNSGLPFGKLAINVATPQIERSDFVATLRNTLQETGFPAEHLEIEVTESVIMESAGEALRTMNAIQAMGITTAIDDFGTGYSSLAYLKQLPNDNLKIDRAFIKDLPGQPEDATITRAIISMGHSLGFRVIAEGIETEEQWRFLKEECCDEIQGYWVSHPMPAPEFEAWIRKRTA